MLIIFESILPIFLLVLLGVALKRSPLINGTFWEGLEQCGYYVLFPALLFHTLATADFSSMEIGTLGFTAVIAVLLMCALVLALWVPFKRLGVAPSAFSSVFQTATRWNAFIALAIAQKIYGEFGLTVVALVMAVIIVPINLINVSVLLWFSGSRTTYRAFLLRIVTNPLIISSMLGVAVNQIGVPIYAPLMTTVDLVARAALSLGLIAVGAGLRVSDALKPHPLVLLSSALKLAFFPMLMVACALLAGVTGPAIALLALSASVPTAMNGYILAKKMGGDAELYAATATVQTVISFLTVPLVLMAADQLAAG
ncbi:putative permease [Pseudorhizobium tarimense]|uniref:Permease n=1 Tax=Pseudorhizobium tarimense TaxID=1079109 RepID=A0ABV2H5A3_9HYPH|nr:AEC family transporter [Pseudorhizobium tarimense]MCJ8518939.1 AEC family transporter [Pseudorhizobium tarimense]